MCKSFGTEAMGTLAGLSMHDDQCINCIEMCSSAKSRIRSVTYHVHWFHFKTALFSQEPDKECYLSRSFAQGFHCQPCNAHVQRAPTIAHGSMFPCMFLPSGFSLAPTEKREHTQDPRSLMHLSASTRQVHLHHPCASEPPRH